MGILASSTVRITEEETAFKAAISQATAQRLGGAINGLLDNAAPKLGDVVMSMLTQAQFQAERDATWVLMTGQNIAGSDLNILTGITTLPDMVSNKAFVRQAANDGTIGDFENEEVGSHDHALTPTGDTFQGIRPGSAGVNRLDDGTLLEGSFTRTGLNTGTENRPVNYQMNYFIKINN